MRTITRDERNQQIYEYSQEIFKIIQENETPDFITENEESYIVDYLKITKTNKEIAEITSSSMLKKVNTFRNFDEKYIVYDVYASDDYNIIVNPFLLKVILDGLKEKYDKQ